MEMLGFQDWHIHVTSIESFKKFCEELNHRWNQIKDPHKKPPSICLCNHNYILSEDICRITGGYYDIDIRSGFGIYTQDGMHLNIIDPDSSARKFLRKVQEDKGFWMIDLFIALDKLGYTIDIQDLLETCNKRLFELEVDDIITYMINYLEEIEFTTLEEAYEIIIKPLIELNPLKRYNGENLYSVLKGNRVALTDLNHIDDLEYVIGKYPMINSFIHNSNTPFEHMEFLLRKKAKHELLHGTGLWL